MAINNKDAVAAFAKKHSENFKEGAQIHADAEKWANIARNNLVYVTGYLPPGYKVVDDGVKPRGQQVEGYGIIHNQPVRESGTLRSLNKLIMREELPDTGNVRSPLLFCISHLPPDEPIMGGLKLGLGVDTVVTYRMETAGYRNNYGTGFKWATDTRPGNFVRVHALVSSESADWLEARVLEFPEVAEASFWLMFPEREFVLGGLPINRFFADKLAVLDRRTGLQELVPFKYRIGEEKRPWSY